MSDLQQIKRIEKVIKSINDTIIHLHGLKRVEEIRDNLCDSRFQLEQELAKLKKEAQSE